MLKYFSLSSATVAQPVEQLIRNQQVVCSSHISSSMLKATFWFFEPECSFFIFPPSMINWLTVCIMEGFLCFSM